MSSESFFSLKNEEFEISMHDSLFLSNQFNSNCSTYSGYIGIQTSIIILVVYSNCSTYSSLLFILKTYIKIKTQIMWLVLKHTFFLCSCVDKKWFLKPTSSMWVYIIFVHKFAYICKWKICQIFAVFLLFFPAVFCCFWLLYFCFFCCCFCCFWLLFFCYFCCFLLFSVVILLLFFCCFFFFPNVVLGCL